MSDEELIQRLLDKAIALQVIISDVDEALGYGPDDSRWKAGMTRGQVIRQLIESNLEGRPEEPTGDNGHGGDSLGRVEEFIAEKLDELPAGVEDPDTEYIY